MILIAGFEGKNNSSNIALNKLKNKNIRNVELLYLKNNKVLCTEQMAKKLNNAYEKIILLGQKPLIKEKLSIEQQAKQGAKILTTNYNLESLKNFMNNNNIKFYLSKNCGTSYCNHIYYFTLNYVLKNCLNTQVVFIHLPYVKNLGRLMQNF